jgi:hypothetical protein
MCIFHGFLAYKYHIFLISSMKRRGTRSLGTRKPHCAVRRYFLDKRSMNYLAVWPTSSRMPKLMFA